MKPVALSSPPEAAGITVTSSRSVGVIEALRRVAVSCSGPACAGVIGAADRLREITARTAAGTTAVAARAGAAEDDAEATRTVAACAFAGVTT